MATDNRDQNPLGGLKKLRGRKDASLVMCSNCKCQRYGPCGCMKKGEKKGHKGGSEEAAS
jgi:hypothetical protein